MINMSYKRFSHSEPSLPFSRAGGKHPLLVFVGISVPTSLLTGIYFVGVSLVCSMIFFPSQYCILEGSPWQDTRVSLCFSMVKCYSRVCKNYNLFHQSSFEGDSPLVFTDAS